MWFVDFIMPVTGAIITLVIIVVVIVVGGKTKQAELSSISKRRFENLASKLLEENAQMKAELAAMKEQLTSINKLLKEVE